MREIIKNTKNLLSSSITNAKGWKSDKKIIIIESDDWGSIRMQSKVAYNNLLSKGIRVDKSLYDTFDSLENKQDLENLFNVLQENATDSSQPIFTFNTVIQNPNFEEIRKDNFEKFYGIDLFDSYKAYYGEDLQSLWQKSIDENIMIPQYHAREHLNAYLWLNDLKLGYKDTIDGFDNNFFGLKTATSSQLRNHYLATYFSETVEEFDFVKNALRDGVNQFNKLFSFDSKSFIASNYFWPTELEEELNKLKFKSIQGQRKQAHTDFTKGAVNHISHFTGQKNSFGQNYTVRNVTFEPYLNQNLDWASHAFKEIEDAFFWKTPAIISSHRINYASNMCVKNRDSSINHLSELLKKINRKHPDVLYLSSSHLADLIK